MSNAALRACDPNQFDGEFPREVNNLRDAIDFVTRAAAQRRIDRNLKELAMTETELRLIAALAIIGLSRIPKNG